MASQFDLGGFLLRWASAALLVFGTYNPTAYSYISWAIDSETRFGPVVVIIGLILLIGWIIFLRATFMAIGWLGVILGALLFAAIIWLFIDIGWLSLESTTALTWLALLLMSVILAVGVSWAHLRRMFSGQLSVDDVED
ncbi:MAG: DUF6524 family protein [Pseudomonadales bacterium]|jgi:hypothetical protein|nr:DUF6524 family protein [Pseudomonadales bacterium]